MDKIEAKIEAMKKHFKVDTDEIVERIKEEYEIKDRPVCEDCISRQAAIEAFCDDCRGLKPGQCEHWDSCKSQKELRSLPPVKPKVSEDVKDMGEVSDGYHTFNQLYHQRAVLFATIVNQNKDKAWKSWKHEDGKFCFDKEKEWFIVGVDTPEGSYTYHYEKKYWDLFDCEELDRGKHWDGHTEDDVTRLLSLPPVTPTERTGKLIVSGMEDDGRYMGSRWYACDQCGRAGDIGDNFCRGCGARLKGGTENDGQRHTGSHR